MIQFITNRKAKHRVAELCREIETNGGTPPQNCDGFQTSHEAKKEIAKLEDILADCRARKAAAKPGTPALIACLSEKLTGPSAAVKNAVAARLDASKAMLAAAEAKARAKAAVAALQPAPLAVQMEAAPMPAGLSPSERRAFAKAQATMTPENAKTFSDEYLRTAAVHPLSPPAEAAIAKTTLESRGYVFHGRTISKSLR